jgi:predicted transcriptional regulator
MNELLMKFKVSEIAEILAARLVNGNPGAKHEIEYAFASDLMSDVLTINKNDVLMITGLANLQAIRTAEMSDINCIVFVRGKKASPEMIKLANENGITLLECPYTMFKASGLLYQQGIKALF